MSCVALFLKGASNTFTGYFLIVSLAFISYGFTTTIYMARTNSVEILEHQLIALPSLTLLVFGTILFITIIVGCCAVCREIPCGLETYSTMLIALATAQIAMGIFSLIHFSIHNDELRAEIYTSVANMIDNYETNPQQVDIIQDLLKCCGYMNFEEWLRNSTIPASCCENRNMECTIIEVYPEGCSLELYRFVVGSNYIIGLALIVTAITEVIAAIMGFSLSCAFWRNNRIMWI